MDLGIIESRTIIHEDADKNIESCWDISKEDRDSVNTTRQRTGALKTALCMEDYIIKLSKQYLFPHNPDKVIQIESDLKGLRMSYGGLYWKLYNEHVGCEMPTGCGTTSQTVHNEMYVHLLENIIHDIHGQIDEYKLRSDD